jgi:hypothetical protein
VATEAREPAQSAARRAADSRVLRGLAQLGFTGYGLLHLLVAWLALELAWGPQTRRESGRTTDQSGALSVLHRSPGGAVLLWVLAVGLGGLALWQAVEVVRHHSRPPPPGSERRQALVALAKTGASAVMYGFLAVSAARAALGDGSRRGDEEQTVRGVLAWPGGREIVIAVGVVVVAIGGYLVQKGLRSGFLDEIDLGTVAPTLRMLTHRLSQVGFALKGVALVLVGAVVAWASLRFDPAQATGLDGALRTVAAEPYGRWVLTVVAAGLVSFTAYCLARARHPVG